MNDDTRKDALRQAEALGSDTIEARMRTRVRETIEAIVEQELEADWAPRSPYASVPRARAIGMGPASGH